MTETDAPSLNTAGVYVDLGQLWVRYDVVGTVKPTEEGEPACLVVLTLPGYKTLRVACEARVLLATLESLRSRHEFAIGHERARGMR